MGNNGAKTDLQILYGARCMLTMVKTRLTYHHIEKAEHGGPSTVDNGAILSEASQEWLHNNIERADPELFDLINECLILYKMSMDAGKEELVQMYQEECVPEFQKRISMRKHK